MLDIGFKVCLGSDIKEVRAFLKSLWKHPFTIVLLSVVGTNMLCTSNK